MKLQKKLTANFATVMRRTLIVVRRTIAPVMALLFVLVVSTPNSFAQNTKSMSIDAIIDRLEANRVYEELKGKGTIKVSDQYGTRTTDMIYQSRGEEYSLIEFTSAAEKGQKTLRVKDKIYLYYPDAEQIITLNKSMFQQTILDSDISYEDMAGDRSIKNNFNAELEGVEQKNGQETFKIYLSAKNDKKETYPYQRIWVRTDNFTMIAAELFTRRKILRKTITVNQITKLEDGRYIGSDVLYSDVLKKNSGTQILLSDLKLAKLDSNVFSIENLKF